MKIPIATKHHGDVKFDVHFRSISLFEAVAGRKDIVQLPATCVKLKLGAVYSPLLDRGLYLVTIFMASSLFLKQGCIYKSLRFSQFPGTLGDLVNNSGVQVKLVFN